MNFTGQVKVPEVDHPGVPATFVVEDGHAEVLLDGESLGRWSLYDVEATRLVSSAFSVRLGQEEITFIADEPIDFAYKGVEHMAEKWARYKSMALPRRMVAVSKSRRGATPSRIEDLRRAMLENIRGGTVPVARPPKPERVAVERPKFVEPAAELPVGEEPAAEKPAAEVAPSTATEPPKPRRRLLPGPGLFAPAKTEPEPVSEVGLDEVITEPLVPLLEDDLEVAAAQVEELAEQTGEPEVEKADREQVEPAAEVEVEAAVERDAEPAEAEVEAAVERDAEPEEAEVEPAPEPQPVGEAQPVPETTAHEEAEVGEDDGGTSGPADDERGRGLLVDLGDLEESTEGLDGLAPAVPQPQPTVDPDPEPVLAAASAERSGLFGAVRSAFVRGRASHEHDFVEAPGGIGITRQICSECGHISIAVTD